MMLSPVGNLSVGHSGGLPSNNSSFLRGVHPNFLVRLAS